jgi:hypothetical protein
MPIEVFGSGLADFFAAVISSFAAVISEEVLSFKC